MSDVRLLDRLKYAFDNSMARGTSALIAWLGAATGAFLVIASLLVLALGLLPDGVESMSFGEVLWFGLMRTLDAGTMGGDEGSWLFKFAMLGITLGGIFIVSILIGVITSGVEARVEELRKGRSRVIEEGHTVILGWSPQVFSILGELAAANENKRDACVVILADVDKVEMEDALRERVPTRKTTRFVCRTGSPTDLNDLAMASVKTSRSIIVLAPEGDDADIDVIKSILAITNAPDRRTAPYHIVAEIRDPANMEAARLVGREEAELVLAGDLISRITVQTCRQNGLSVVHTELLDFGGDEIYFKAEPALAGKTFGDALFAYEDSSVIGLRTADARILLNPPMDTRIAPGDQLIAISEDDDTIRLSGKTPDVDAAAIQTGAPTPPRPERSLILGWNWRAPRIIQGLDAYVAPGSLVTVVAQVPDEAIDAVSGGLVNQVLSFQAGDTTERAVLESLDVPGFDHIIILCSDGIDPQKADARVLVTLLHLRDMGEKAQRDFSIVSEMLDVRNRELAEVTKADDFIVSERLVSLMLAQISENKELAAVFEDLFDPEGSEIYVKPALDYVAGGKDVSFYTVLEAARRRGEIAIGYKLAAHQRDGSKAYGVVVNPLKSEAIRFGERDKVIVIAES